MWTILKEYPLAFVTALALHGGAVALVFSSGVSLGGNGGDGIIEVTLARNSQSTAVGQSSLSDLSQLIESTAVQSFAPPVLVANPQPPARKRIRQERASLAPKAAVVELRSPSHGSEVQCGSTCGRADDESLGRPGTLGVGNKLAVLFAPKPRYPADARRDGFEGRVLLDVLVNPDGDAHEAVVIQSSGRSDCDEAARSTVVDRWKFTEHGESESIHQKVAVTYKLQS